MERNNNEIRVALVGGGTGGHFYPLIALAERMNETPESPRLYYMGPEIYDAEALASERIEYVRTWAGKHRRYFSLQNFIDPFKTFAGSVTAFFELFAIYPDVIVSKGGYTSVPVILAAAFLRIPIVIHESDAVMGKANRLAARFARAIVIAYDSIVMPKTRAQVYKLGIPIRRTLLSEPSSEIKSHLSITSDRPIIFVVGGSQGAERVNELILDSLDELLNDFTVLHQTGKKNYDICKLSADSLIPDTDRRQHYYPVPFLSVEELNSAYRGASLIISRAGSTSIYEIALNGKPSIIIPIPEGISHDQRTNAYTYARSGAATVMEEMNLTDGLLRAEIDRIMQNEDIYTGMVTAAKSFGRTDTAEHMTTLVLDIAKEHIY